ncbi:MAG TPA: LysR substrate-binding domain-containing protein [Gemmatimonadaceae bacterium]|jgi:DNA-binding transcriptional LysR family regulator|nr:LysR substrate-binding domain-containing protein [Gemmatimonadaceae bacterium]
MELRHLRYFVAVAEELHFGRAAERLNIAQPPLSRQIRDLERELGTPLFERGPRGAELTPAGRAFLPEARLTLAQAERAQRTAQRAAQGETGRLRVGFVDAATNSGILPDVLGFFRMHLPAIGLSLFEMDPIQQAEALRDGRIDLGILQSPPADAERWLRVESVHAEPLVAALTRGHKLLTRTRLSLADFADEPFILFPRHVAPTLYDDIMARCRSARFTPRVVQEASGWHTVISLVSAGVGLAFVPQSLAESRQSGVVFRPVRDLRVEMGLWTVWKRGETSPVRQRFVTALKSVARARTSK